MVKYMFLTGVAVILFSGSSYAGCPIDADLASRRLCGADAWGKCSSNADEAEAIKNMHWVLSEDAGARKTYEKHFHDPCPGKDVYTRHVAAMILAQQHNPGAFCSMYGCFSYLRGYIMDGNLNLAK